jgi:phage shock protein C
MSKKTSPKPKKIYRSTQDKMLAGVCGGIAEYFDWDSSMVRLVAVLTVVLGGSGILAYIIMWIIVPENPELKN